MHITIFVSRWSNEDDYNETDYYIDDCGTEDDYEEVDSDDDDDVMMVILHAFLWGSVLSVQIVCLLYRAERIWAAPVDHHSDRCFTEPQRHIEEQHWSPTGRLEAV